MLLLRTSLGMDVDFNKTDENKQYLRFHKLGGILDFKFFLSDDSGSPESAIKIYHSYLGGYFVPPFWAMGYHQCRWGYN